MPHRTAVVRVQWRVMAISLSGNFERSDFWRSVRDIGDGVLRDRGLAGWTVTFRPATAADMQHMDTDGVGQDDAQWTLDADAAARSVTVGVMAGSAEFIEPGEVVGGATDLRTDPPRQHVARVGECEGGETDYRHACLPAEMVGIDLADGYVRAPMSYIRLFSIRTRLVCWLVNGASKPRLLKTDDVRRMTLFVMLTS